MASINATYCNQVGGARGLTANGFIGIYGPTAAVSVTIDAPDVQVDDPSHWQPVPSVVPIAVQVSEFVALPSVQVVAA